MRQLRSERGATAVELGLLLPVLILLLLGIVEFGRAFQVQSTLSSAAREGVRQMALHNDQTVARAAVRDAASALNPAVTDDRIEISPTACPPVVGDDTSVRLTIRYPMPFLTSFFGSGLDLTGTGVMRCNG